MPVHYTETDYRLYWPNFLALPTRSAVCIWRNILVFHFASYSICNLLFYGCTLYIPTFWLLYISETSWQKWLIRKARTRREGRRRAEGGEKKRREKKRREEERRRRGEEEKGEGRRRVEGGERKRREKKRREKESRRRRAEAETE